MTQEHFLIEAANQAVHEQSYSSLFREYDDIEANWPWQTPVEQWIDHILSFATKPESMSAFLDPHLQGGGQIYFRVDGAVLPGSQFTAKQYDQIITAIIARAVFPQSVVGQILQEGFILTEAGHKNWVGLLQTVAGIQVTFWFENSLGSIDPLANWPAQAKVVVEQMQNHPNGLMICCHRGWSLSQQGTIFNVFDSLISRSNGTARIGCITEGLQPLIRYENTTQLCVDGSKQSWEQAARALVAQDIDVLMMRGRNEKEVVTQAVLTALEDRCVLVDVSHFSVIDTLIWLLTELPISPSHIASVLLGIVGSYSGLRQVCPHCSTKQLPDDNFLRLLDQHNIPLITDGKWAKGQGCPKCYGMGYAPKQRLTVVEAAYLNRSIGNLWTPHPDKERLELALTASGCQTYFEQAVNFAQQGMTTPQEAIRVGLAHRNEL